MANEGTSFDEGWKLVSMDCVCVFQVILAYESIVLCKCSGNVLIGFLTYLPEYLISTLPHPRQTHRQRKRKKTIPTVNGS